VRRLRRPVRALVVVLAALLVAPACGKADRVDKEMLGYIRATKRLPFSYVYSESTDKRKVEVQGLFEDDFRYKARVLVNGQQTLDQVVNDDAIAVRFVDPGSIGDFLDKDLAAPPDTKTNLDGVSIVDALRSRRWVVDRAGAPSLLSGARDLGNLGVDPVSDSLVVWDYVHRSINEAASVQKYSEDSLDPAYKRTEDPFPAPEDGSGVTRYDLRRPRLPQPGASSGAARDALPATRHFRKMAIYVKDGHVIRILERVELSGVAVGDFKGYLKTVLKANDTPQQYIDEFEQAVEKKAPAERGAFLLDGLNRVLAFAGAEPVAIRSMSFDLRKIGDKSIHVVMPGDQTIEGSLAVLVNRGRKPQPKTPT
jgi:hypothetical protein